MQEKKCTPVNFAENLAQLIAARGITQKRLAADVGVSEASVVKWLKGSTPLGGTLNKLADYFDLHPEHLLHPRKALVLRIKSPPPTTNGEVEWARRALTAENSLTNLREKLGALQVAIADAIQEIELIKSHKD